MYVSVIDSPLGKMELRTDERAVLYFLPAEENAQLSKPKDPVGKEAERQLAEYFDGKRTEFSVRTDPSGTEFQKRAWCALQEIPFGGMRTYGEIAEMMGNPKGARAVGGAVGANPVLILIPCHRIIARNGIGGFSAGQWRKRALLLWEGNDVL